MIVHFYLVKISLVFLDWGSESAVCGACSESVQNSRGWSSWFRHPKCDTGTNRWGVGWGRRGNVQPPMCLPPWMFSSLAPPPPPPPMLRHPKLGTSFLPPPPWYLQPQNYSVSFYNNDPRIIVHTKTGDAEYILNVLVVFCYRIDKGKTVLYIKSC